MWLLRRVHTYAGLLTFINLAVYGVVGLSVTFLRQAGPPASVIGYQDFSGGPNLTDRQVAERVCSQLRLSLSTPVNSFASYPDTLHSTTAAFHSGDWRMQLWADYNEFAMWRLLAMTHRASRCFWPSAPEAGSHRFPSL
jgi:hypothetical protein